MPITLAIAGRSPIELDEENITLGSDPSCAVTFPQSSGVLPKHAVIRTIAGRWLVEVREAESVIVAGEPKRLFWLNPGDEIRLTPNAPKITFQPQADEPLPVSMPLSSEVVLPPDSSPSLPVTKKSSSENIRVPKPPSSTTIRTTKPPSSTTIRTTNASATNHSDKKSRSSSEIPATGAGAPSKRRSGQVSIPKSDDEPDPDTPVLQRLSSWEEDDPTVRRGMTEEQAEIRWIMMVVGRAVGAGLVVLILWITISWIMKSMQPDSLQTLPGMPPATTQSSETPVSPAPQPAPVSVEPPRPKPVASAESSAQKPPTVDKSSKDSETKASKPQGSGTTTPTGTGRPKPETERAKPESEESPTNKKPEAASASPVMKAVKDGIYAVVMEDADKLKKVYLGTAWAASRRHLVTSAMVVMAIEDYQQQGMIASVVQCSSGTSMRIKSSRFHDTYRKATESVEEAKEQKDTSRVATERANQVRFDLGVLDVGRTVKLPKKLASFTEPLDESKESVFVMVGLPVDSKDDSAEPKSGNELKERRCKQPTSGAAPQNKDMELTIQFANDAAGRNWSGSPVLNKDHKVIGVYSQLPASTLSGGKPIKPEFGVAWIGRLHEFASDVE